MSVAQDGVAEMKIEAAGADLDSIFRAHYARIARVIAGVIHDPARAEELALEVFLKWERTPQARGDGAEGWLYRAAIRVALDELRRRTVRSRYERLIGFLTHGGRAATPGEIYESGEENRMVQEVLRALPRGQAEMLLLRANDFSYQEVASAMKLNPASVGTLLSRAADSFRKEFIRRYGEERYGTE